jgi:hypothetical protein
VLEDFGPTLASEHLASDDGLQVQDRLVKLRLAGIANYEQANFYCGMTVRRELTSCRLNRQTRQLCGALPATPDVALPDRSPN